MIPAKEALGRAETMPRNCFRLKWEKDDVYIARNEWALGRDPNNFPKDYPLHWIPGFSFKGSLTLPDSWIHKKIKAKNVKGFPNPRAAKKLGRFLSVESMRKADDRIGKARLCALNKSKDVKTIVRASQKSVSDICKNLYEEETKTFLQGLKEEYKIVDIPEGTQLELVTRKEDDECLAEKMFEGEVNGETVYVSVVDYVLQRLANDKHAGVKDASSADAEKPAGAKGGKKKKGRVKK